LVEQYLPAPIFILLGMVLNSFPQVAHFVIIKIGLAAAPGKDNGKALKDIVLLFPGA